MARKPLIGNTLRRLRTERSLTQQSLAISLGISSSYLNLIESNRRPVTASLLIKLAERFGVELAALSGEPSREIEPAVREALSDPALGLEPPGPEEIATLADSAPNAAASVVALYRAYRAAREDAGEIALPSGRRVRVLLPTEEAREFVHAHQNHFPKVEAAAEALRHEIGPGTQDLRHRLVERLAARHGITVAVLPEEALDGALRRFDSQSRRLLLAETLPPESRSFHLAAHVGLLEAIEVVEAEAATAEPGTPEGGTMIRVALLNYFAGAVMMPYVAFAETARAMRHDVMRLGARFGASFEQVCHRLTTLARPGARGVSFWFVRTDIAGNVSKRFSAAGFPFTRFGGSCPRFVVHQVFATPGQVRTQVARLADGGSFFCFARTLRRPGIGPREPAVHMAIAMGCDVADAGHVTYADGIDVSAANAATEIGLSCRACERPNCRERAFPPLAHRLRLDTAVKGVSPYAFEPRN